MKLSLISVSSTLHNKMFNSMLFTDFIEIIPDYLLGIPQKYGINIDIMIEAKRKELAVAKYLELHG